MPMPIAIAIATPFLLTVIVTPVTTSMTIVMFSER
jgi:hypothetical protein